MRIPTAIAVWIAVVIVGLAVLTVGALLVDHEQIAQYLRVTDAPAPFH